MKTRKAICQGCYSGPVGHTHTPQYTPKQHRQAQDLAVQLGHLNKGIPSLIDLYAAAPMMKAENERLMALNLELLNAAKAAVKAMKNDGFAWKHGVVELREAIAKAEGRS